jgi:hypothetical protein
MSAGRNSKEIRPRAASRLCIPTTMSGSGSGATPAPEQIQNLGPATLPLSPSDIFIVSQNGVARQVAAGNLPSGGGGGGPVNTIAAAGNSQATAAIMTFPNMTVVAGTAGQGVLSPYAPNFVQPVRNRAGVPLLIYPSSGAQIESQGTNVGYPFPANSNATITWESPTQARIS